MQTNVHFMSRSDNWATPGFLFQALDAEFKFDIDACATAENAKCKTYFSPEVDGLQQEWRGSTFVNPPYGRQIGRWVQKAYESALEGALVVCLLPARTDTSWWHKYVMRGEIRFFRGRLRFGNAKNAAPFPSAVVIFYPPKLHTLAAR